MKIKSTIIILFLFCFVQVQAQESEVIKTREYTLDSTKIDNYVEEAYGDKAQELIYDHPIRLKTIRDILLNRVLIVETSFEIPSTYKKLSSIEVLPYNKNLQRNKFNIETFNPLKYKIDFYNKKENQYIHIDGTQFYMIIEKFEAENLNK
ncbi:hypothetical protein [Mesonia aquimarina]|uniref:hypothetical protein n=1 Tax=Mesonia aquimarina TaxID=1504967 RepID=UPI000EF5D5B8|nr:hypothetical protein [Mesonia aquimarina]